MSIKLIATDMDGTFLNDQNDYDHARFQKTINKDDAKKCPVCGSQR